MKEVIPKSFEKVISKAIQQNNELLLLRALEAPAPPRQHPDETFFEAVTRSAFMNLSDGWEEKLSNLLGVLLNKFAGELDDQKTDKIQRWLLKAYELAANIPHSDQLESVLQQHWSFICNYRGNNGPLLEELCYQAIFNQSRCESSLYFWKALVTECDWAEENSRDRAFDGIWVENFYFPNAGSTLLIEALQRIDIEINASSGDLVRELIEFEQEVLEWCSLQSVIDERLQILLKQILTNSQKVRINDLLGLNLECEPEEVSDELSRSYGELRWFTEIGVNPYGNRETEKVPITARAYSNRQYGEPIAGSSPDRWINDA